MVASMASEHLPIAVNQSLFVDLEYVPAGFIGEPVAPTLVRRLFAPDKLSSAADTGPSVCAVGHQKCSECPRWQYDHVASRRSRSERGHLGYW
jgi:hypothetical protein